MENLASVSWEEFNIRVVSVQGPWQFLWKRSGCVRNVSVDVVPVLIDHKKKGKINERYNEISPSEAILLQGEVLEGAPGHELMRFSILEKTSHPRDLKHFPQSLFAFEWNILDSLPIQCRISIVIAKSIVQVGLHLYLYL